MIISILQILACIWLTLSITMALAGIFYFYRVLPKLLKQINL